MAKIIQTSKHYLDYYSEWLLALTNAKCLFDMKEVQAKADSFIGILNELLDTDRIKAELAATYITEVNKLNWNKYIIFNN